MKDILKDSTFSVEDIDQFDKFIFVFDGAYAYSPKRFCAYMYKYKTKKSISDEIQNEIDKEKRRVSATPILDLLFNSSIPKEHKIFYFPQTSILKAKRILKKIQKEKKDFEVNLLGYSWGGDAVIRFCHYLNKNQIKINKVFTIDPIRRGFLFLGFIKSIRNNSLYFKKLNNITYFANIYQKSDRFCLPLIHLRGNEVKNADLNINLSQIYSNPNHINLIQYKEVINFLN